jgi:N-acetylglucosaminyldiphosphoundecaprenol N-acetyl-beta-D-mannosaminyltransferase
MNSPALLFGVPIDDLTMDETVDAIGELVDDGRRHGRSHQVATVNVDFLVNALDDPEVHTLLQDAALNIADGAPVVWGSRLSGFPLCERVAGADLVPRLVAESAGRGWRIHLFGSAPGVAERAVELFRSSHPHAKVSGASGSLVSPGGAVPDPVLDELASVDADILCVALGNPKQERFIAAHRDRLQVPVMMGIGGTLDLLVGDKQRAPGWAQDFGIEWVFRAAQEPGRLGRRYVRDALVFGPRLLTYVRRVRRHRDGVAPSVALEDSAALSEDPSDQRLDRHGNLQRLVGAAHDGADLCVSFAAGTPNPSALADLVGLLRLARRSGCAVSVVGLSPGTRSDLDALALPRWVRTGFELVRS